MAQKNVLNKVKTASGYDTLYPLTPYQILNATSVSGSGSNFNVTVPLPSANMTVPVYIRFIASNNANVGCTISVNSGTAIAISGNVGGMIKTGDRCLVYYDATNSKCYLIKIENKTNFQQNQMGGTTTFNDDNIVQTLANGGSITTTFGENTVTEVIVQNGYTVIKTTTFNADGTISEVMS